LADCRHNYFTISLHIGLLETKAGHRSKDVKEMKNMVDIK